MGIRNEKEKMEQSFGSAFCDDDCRNTSFRLRWVEFIVGNNDLDFYKFLNENGGLPDIITCCRFSLHDANPLKDSLMDLSTTNVAGAVYDTYLSNFMNKEWNIGFT